MPQPRDYAHTAMAITTLGLQIVTEIVPIPGADVVLNVMESIKESCSDAKVQKDKFDDLKKYVERLREQFEQHWEDMESTSLHKSVAYTLRELEKIDADVRSWSTYSWLKAIFYTVQVNDGLKKHRENVQKLIGQYQYEVGALNALLSKELAEAVEELQKRLNDMRELSFKDDSELVDDNDNPITRVQFEIRFKAFQDQLMEMTKHTGRLGPSQISDAELEIRDNRIVGSGVGSDVVQGMYLRKTKVSVKKLRGLKITNKYIKQFNNNLKLWSSVKRHEHLLLFLGWYKCGQEFSLVSEWQSHGNITQFCCGDREADRLHLLVGVANGLKFLHSLTLDEACVHGKLKGTNILVNNKLEAMLSDFQLAKTISIMNKERGTYDSFTRSPSIRWTSPECLRDRTMTLPGDVWSFAMVMVEIFTLQDPFVEQPSENALVHMICHDNYRPARPKTDWVTDAIWELMQDCWKKPDERPKIDEVYRRIVEAEQARKENPPPERFDHPRYNRFAHLEARYGNFAY